MSITQNDAVAAYNAGLAHAYAEAPTPAPPQIPPHAASYIAKTTPLADRLRVQLAKIPPEAMQYGMEMKQLWGLCSGVQRSKPPAHAVGAALRALGWVRYRRYSDSGPSSTWWMPPTVDFEQAKAMIRERT
jgi:hypothetical protein